MIQPQDYIFPKKVTQPSKRLAGITGQTTTDGFAAQWSGAKSPSPQVISEFLDYWYAFERFFPVSRDEKGSDLRIVYERLCAGPGSSSVNYVTSADASGPVAKEMATLARSYTDGSPPKVCGKNLYKPIPPDIYMKQHGWFDAGKYWLRRVTATISTSGSGASLTVKLVGRAESIQEGVNIYGAEARWWGQAHILALVTEVDGSKITKNAGVVRYVGPIDGKPGVWVGIEVDKANGRNDGSVAGKKYFTCAPKKGIFVLPEEIENESP